MVDKDFIEETDDSEDYISETSNGWEDEEVGIDHHLMHQYEDAPVPATPEPASQSASGRKYKIKRMPKSWLTKFKGVESILITKTDGKQVLFIR